MYCSKDCQREDWKKQHKKICKFLSVGNGAMQMRTDTHRSRSIELKEKFDKGERFRDVHMKRFFKLFEESTLEGSQAAAREMRKIARRQTKYIQESFLFHSLHVLVRCSKSEMLLWPNSPLLVLLQFVDPSVLSAGEETRETPLHQLGDLADSYKYSSHQNQLILSKQLIEHGANVNAPSIPHGIKPLHKACHSGNVTNLDFVELLLEKGADANAQCHTGDTPLMFTMPDAPGAAKFLLSWPTTDVNITALSGVTSGMSFLTKVRCTINYVSDEISDPDNPGKVQHQFLLPQWHKIEDMLVERGALDPWITAHL
jgi:hypothetical protein